MATFWWGVFFGAFLRSLEFIGKGPGEVSTSVIVFIVVGILLIRREGWPKGSQEMKARLRKVIGEDLRIAAIIFCFILIFQMGQGAYSKWRDANTASQNWESKYKSLLSKSNKPTAIVEIAAFNTLFDPTRKQVVSFIHAKALGPDIARNIQGMVWVIPAPVAHDERDDFIENLLFSNMLKSFRKTKAQHPYGIGPSLAKDGMQDFTGVSPIMSDDDYKRWKHRQTIVYLISEITWQDDAGDWKTDLCERLEAPIKIPNEPSGIGVHATCGGHNGIAEPLQPN